MDRGERPSGEEWTEFAAAYAAADLMPSVSRPDLVVDAPSDGLWAPYRQAWLLARVMEVLWCWRSQPVALTDLAYAASHAEVDVAAVVRECI